MIIKCIDNDLCSTLTLNKEYVVIEEAPEYYVIIDDKNDETTCRKSRFEIIEDGGLTKKAKATITELTYQLENDFKDINNFQLEKIQKVKLKKYL